MTEAHIGRLLAACLHQAIADRLPQRLEFYEHWLNSEDLSDGSIGLAPLTAVIGFLRTEGSDYEGVVTRAGELAASWSVATLGPVRRRTIAWLPRGLRVRAVLHVAAGVVRVISSTSRTSTKFARRTANVEVRQSVFCGIRETASNPLCGFYRALMIEMLRQFDLAASGRTESCRAMGSKACMMVLHLPESGAVVDPAIAA